MSNVFEIPKSVAEALAQTAEEVEPLFKGSENHFQNYKYWEKVHPNLGKK